MLLARVDYFKVKLMYLNRKGYEPLKQFMTTLIEEIGKKLGLKREWIQLGLKVFRLLETKTTQRSGHLASVQFAAGVDGDTSKFYIDGKRQTIRYLLIDTPESVKPNTPVQPFAKEASAFTTNALKRAKTIELDYDQTGDRGDKYGRKLAYVYADGKDLNEALLRKGLARVAFVHEPNTKHHAKYLEAQAYAQKHQLGIWSIPGYVTKRGFREHVR